MEVLARTIYGEARGEPDAGKVAVAWVVLNRAADPRWPDTVAGVCLQRAQFSCWNDRDPNRAALIAITLEDEDLRICMAAGWQAVGGITGDPTRGANHYLTAALAERTPPAWFDWAHVTARIGGHLFLTLA